MADLVRSQLNPRIPLILFGIKWDSECRNPVAIINHCRASTYQCDKRLGAADQLSLPGSLQAITIEEVGHPSSVGRAADS